MPPELPLPKFTRARDNWSVDETAALIATWAPLYRRRRTGEGDMWALPPRLVGRARSSRALVCEDWRAVASAVNTYRAGAGLGFSIRTHEQCKGRVQTLKKLYTKGLAAPSRWPFFDALHAVWGGEEWSRDAACRRAAAGNASGSAAGGHGGAAAGMVDGAAEAEVHGRVEADEEGVVATGAHGGVALASTEVHGGGVAAAVDVLGGRIPKRPRTGASTSAASDASAAAVKKEILRAGRAVAGAEDGGRRSGDDTGDAAHRAADAFLASVEAAPWRLGGASATAGSDNATAAVLKVADMCVQIMNKGYELDLARLRRGGVSTSY